MEGLTAGAIQNFLLLGRNQLGGADWPARPQSHPGNTIAHPDRSPRPIGRSLPPGAVDRIPRITGNLASNTHIRVGIRPNFALSVSVSLRTEIPHPRQPPPSLRMVSKHTSAAEGLAPTAATGQTGTAAKFALYRQNLGILTRPIILPTKKPTMPPTRLLHPKKY